MRSVLQNLTLKECLLGWEEQDFEGRGDNCALCEGREYLSHLECSWPRKIGVAGCVLVIVFMICNLEMKNPQLREVNVVSRRLDFCQGHPPIQFSAAPAGLQYINVLQVQYGKTFAFNTIFKFITLFLLSYT